MFLGRFILGDRVLVSVSSDTPALVPTLPAETPSAKIFTSAGVLVETVKLPILDSGDKIFQEMLFLGSLYSAGRYHILHRWKISSTVYQSAATFDILTGGDVDGKVLSMTRYEPSSPHLIYETESGKIRAGRNPTL